MGEREILIGRALDSDALVDSRAVMEWGIRGDLKGEELLKMPPGAHRMAETSLWSLEASPEELRKHWQAVLASGETDMRTLDHLMMLWVRSDPDGAVAFAKGGDQEFRCLWALAKMDPERALAVMDPKDLNVVSTLLRAIGQTNPEYAMKLREEYPNHVWHDVVRGIVDGLFDADPEGALNYAVSEGVGDNEKFRLWAARDSKRAFDWAVENRSFAAHLLGDLVPLFMEGDPGYFQVRIERLPAGDLKSKLVAAQLKYLARDDPQAAIALADAQDGKVSQRVSRIEIGKGLVGTSPDLAKEVLGSLFEDEPYGPESSLWGRDWIRTLVDQDPQGILELAKEKGEWDDPMRANYLEMAAMKQWASRDHDGVEEWLGKQAKGEHWDWLASDLVDDQLGHSSTDYASLLSISSGIGQKELEEGMTRRVISEWHQRKPEEVKAYFEQSEVLPRQVEFYQKLTGEK